MSKNIKYCVTSFMEHPKRENRSKVEMYLDFFPFWQFQTFLVVRFFLTDKIDFAVKSSNRVKFDLNNFELFILKNLILFTPSQISDLSNQYFDKTII